MGMKQFIYTVVQQAVREVITKEVIVRIDNIEKTFGQRIDSLNQRISAVEKNLIERFEVRFDSIEKSIATIQGNLEGEARFFHLADYLNKYQSRK